MKNKEAFIVIGVIIVALILVFTLGSGDKSKPKKSSSDTKEVNSILANAEKESESVKETEKKEFNSINVSDLVDYYKEEDSKIVLIARPTCHYCQIAEPILHNIAYKYDLDINYLNTDDFTEDDEKSFEEIDELFSQGIGTPLLLIVGDGRIIDTVDGLTDTSHYVSFFKDNGFIK